MEEGRRLDIDGLSQTDLEQLWTDFIEEIQVGATGQRRRRTAFTLPYLAVIRRRLGDQRLVDGQAQFGAVCEGILRDKLTNPCLLELIWSYWHEEGMLVQTLNAISVRFQNRLGPRASDPLARLEIDPLRPLNNLLWGYIQDEQHRLTVLRRAYEYDHHYGLTLVGRAVPAIRGADSRSKFLEAFHNLLNLTSHLLQGGRRHHRPRRRVPAAQRPQGRPPAAHRGRAQPVRRPAVDGPPGDAHAAVAAGPAGDARVPADADDGGLPGGVDGPRSTP